MFLMIVKEASIEEDSNEEAAQSSLPKSYLRVHRLVSLDPFVSIHGPTTKIDGRKYLF